MSFEPPKLVDHFPHQARRHQSASFVCIPAPSIHTPNLCLERNVELILELCRPCFRRAKGPTATDPLQSTRATALHDLKLPLHHISLCLKGPCALCDKGAFLAEKAFGIDGFGKDEACVAVGEVGHLIGGGGAAFDLGVGFGIWREGEDHFGGRHAGSGGLTTVLVPRGWRGDAGQA